MKRFFGLFAAWFIALTVFCGASDADIQAAAAEVSEAQYKAYQLAIEEMGLGKYGGELYNQKTRGRAFSGNLGDKGNQEARKFLIETLAGFGLRAAAQGRYQNVVADQAGSTDPEHILILCAHYDTKKSNTPGGDGDASGVAGLLEAARVLSRHKFDKSIRYVVFNATEKGYRGSDDYAFNVLGPARDKVVGVIDLNQILHPYHDKNPALPQAVAVGLGTRAAAATQWANAFAAAAGQFVPALALDGDAVIDTGSDHYSFVVNGTAPAMRLSQNSSKDKANSAIGTLNDASDASAGAHYDYAFAANVVRAVTAFFAQQGNLVGPADSSGSPFPDTDGDGYDDEIETELGSDPNLASSTPSNLAASVPLGNLEIINAVAAVTFDTASSDVISMSGMMPVSAGFAPKDLTVIVNFGGVVKSFVLSAKGTGKKGVNGFSIAARSIKGVVPAQLAKFSCTFASGNFKKALGRFGLLNGNYVLRPVTIPITIVLAGETRSTLRLMRYSASDDKSGAAH